MGSQKQKALIHLSLAESLGAKNQRSMLSLGLFALPKVFLYFCFRLLSLLHSQRQLSNLLKWLSILRLCCWVLRWNFNHRSFCLRDLKKQEKKALKLEPLLFLVFITGMVQPLGAKCSVYNLAPFFLLLNNQHHRRKHDLNKRPMNDNSGWTRVFSQLFPL